MNTLTDKTTEERHAEYQRERLHARAEILCAMDCLMHHLNNEESSELWLAVGVPDGMPWDILTPNADREADYFDLAEGMDGDEFERHIRLFAGTVRRECFKYQKCAFC